MNTLPNEIEEIILIYAFRDNLTPAPEYTACMQVCKQWYYTLKSFPNYNKIQFHLELMRGNVSATNLKSKIDPSFTYNIVFSFNHLGSYSRDGRLELRIKTYGIDTDSEARALLIYGMGHSWITWSGTRSYIYVQNINEPYSTQKIYRNNILWNTRAILYANLIVKYLTQLV